MKGNVTGEARLKHILDAIRYIERFSSGKSKADLYNDPMYRFSIERQLEIIGEAANKLSPALHGQFPFVPWPKIISFRNFLHTNILVLIWNLSGIFWNKIFQFLNRMSKRY